MFFYKIETIEATTIMAARRANYNSGTGNNYNSGTGNVCELVSSGPASMYTGIRLELDFSTTLTEHLYISAIRTQST